MDAAADRCGRAVRALLFGLVTSVAAVLAHWSGSGMTASPVVVAAGFALSCAVGWRLLPRRRARSVVLGSIGLQLVMHVGFAVSMAVAGMSTVSMILCQGGHVAGIPVDVPPGYLAPQHGALAMVIGLPGVPMLLAHLCAGAVSGSWLCAVDRLGRALLAVVQAVMRSALPEIPPTGTVGLAGPVRRAARREPRAPAYLRDWVSSGCGRRGPPAVAPC